VYRDAFAPPQDIPRPKPWERAPVPAHAPRLLGQKIWKKAGIQAPDNKQDDAALLELQSEGKGARKKQKVRAAKENIGNPRWKSEFPAPESLLHDHSIAEARSGENGQGTGGEGDALRFIPRKRTNTDHVITPRKPLRQTYLNSQAETLLGRSPESPAEKPDRRRKSMRRSIRRSTNVKPSELVPNTPRKRPASNLETAEESIIPMLAAKESPEAVAGPVATQNGSLNAQNKVRETVQRDDNTEATSIVNVMQTPNGAKRRSILRDTRLNTRNSVVGSAVTRDHIVQSRSPVESTEKQPPLHLTPHNSSDAEGISGEDIAQRATYSIFTTATAQESPVTIQSSAATFEPEASTEDTPTSSLAEQPVQDVEPVIQPAEEEDTPNSRGTPTSADAAPGSLDSPSELLVLNADAEQIQITESDTVESPTASSTVYEAGEICKDTLPGSAEQVVELGSPQCESSSADVTPVRSPIDSVVELSPTHAEDPPTEDISSLTVTHEQTEELLQSPTMDLSTFQLVETIPENAPSGGYDDDTDMLRNFLTRVKANKAAKTETGNLKRKRSLPHSPLGLPLGDMDTNISPSLQKPSDVLIDEFDVGLPSSPTKRRKRDDAVATKDEATEPKAIRRSGRTRLPVVKAPPGAPSLIPVRRLGQDRDTTITIRRNKEKELVALTRVNTRKNKGAALSPAEVITLRAEEKTDPALRQRYLKEAFEEKNKGKKSKTSKKNVAWAEELAQFQTTAEEKPESKNGGDKKGAVRAGARNKIALRKPANGIPAPKRRTRERT
jgi:hypothetical protein